MGASNVCRLPRFLLVLRFLRFLILLALLLGRRRARERCGLRVDGLQLRAQLRGLVVLGGFALLFVLLLAFFLLRPLLEGCSLLLQSCQLRLEACDLVGLAAHRFVLLLRRSTGRDGTSVAF